MIYGFCSSSRTLILALILCCRCATLCCSPCLRCPCPWSAKKTAQKWTLATSSWPCRTTLCSWPCSPGRRGGPSQYVQKKERSHCWDALEAGGSGVLCLILQGVVVLKSPAHDKPRTGKDIARVTFDLYRISPKDIFGSLSVKATFQGLYSVSADFQCLGPKKVLR